MKYQKFAKSFAAALALALLLTACSGNASKADSGAPAKSGLTDYTTYQVATAEVTTWNILYSQVATTINVLTNLQDGLLTNDNQGKLVSNLATDWGTEDGGLTWTFHLRQDAVWVNQAGEEQAKLTSADFVTGLEWVLNYAKNESYNVSMPAEMIQGAEDYYQYTYELEQEREGAALDVDLDTFLSYVGIETPDEYTLIYHCTAQLPYFDSVATYVCLYPLAAGVVEKLGVEGYKAATPETLWYSGPYVISTFVSGNEKVFSPNPLWWGADEYERFDSVTVKMVDSADVAFQLFQSGELDYIPLSESNLKTIYENESNEYHDYLTEYRATKFSFQMHLNFNKNKEDGTPDTNWNTAVRNDAFRLSWYYGLDLTDFLKRTNAINPLKCENLTYTPNNLVFTSDGTDYADLVREKAGISSYNGESPVRYNQELGERYKAQAIEELTAQGVTFPVEIDYYIASGNQTTLDTAIVLQQIFSTSLGDDYVKLNIKTYTNSYSTEVSTPRLQSFVINGWGADYADPENFLLQESYGSEEYFYSQYYSNINSLTEADAPGFVAEYQEFTDLVLKAKAITDNLDARYEAFAEAEAYFLQHAFAIPAYLDIGWQLTSVNDYSKVYSLYGAQASRYLNWETSSQLYTTEEYEAFAAAAGN